MGSQPVGVSAAPIASAAMIVKLASAVAT